jgi:hypothetical protein
MSPYRIPQKVQSTSEMVLEKKVKLGKKERESHIWFTPGIRRATLFVFSFFLNLIAERLVI